MAQVLSTHRVRVALEVQVQNGYCISRPEGALTHQQDDLLGMDDCPDMALIRPTRNTARTKHSVRVKRT